MDLALNQQRCRILSSSVSREFPAQAAATLDTKTLGCGHSLRVFAQASVPSGGKAYGPFHSTVDPETCNWKGFTPWLLYRRSTRLKSNGSSLRLR
jgi:hypothetical protein